jgi:hypothetical protein
MLPISFLTDSKAGGVGWLIAKGTDVAKLKEANIPHKNHSLV